MTLAPTPPASPSVRFSTGAYLNAPEDANARLLLFAFRRMGAHGLRDACATHAFFGAFGPGFRRPLVLMRTMMADLAAGATCAISIAPCGSPRMTSAEATVLRILSLAQVQPDRARLLLADLINTRHPDGVLASIAVLAQAFADAGRPITG